MEEKKPGRIKRTVKFIYRTVQTATLLYSISLATQLIKPFDDYIKNRSPPAASFRDDYIDFSNRIVRGIYRIGAEAVDYVVDNVDKDKARQTIDKIVSGGD